MWVDENAGVDRAPFHEGMEAYGTPNVKQKRGSVKELRKVSRRQMECVKEAIKEIRTAGNRRVTCRHYVECERGMTSCWDVSSSIIDSGAVDHLPGVSHIFLEIPANQAPTHEHGG